jgi:hypothetical protein
MSASNQSNPLPNDPKMYRVGRATKSQANNGHRWNIKVGPGWWIYARKANLRECAATLSGNGIDINQVIVPTAGDWKSLGEWIKSGTEPK